MSKTIWDLVISQGGFFDQVNKAPYVTNGQKDYYMLFCKSTRSKRQGEHVFNHCFAMASYCCENGQYSLSCDWTVAAAAFADSEGTFLARLFDLWANLNRRQPTTWPELLREPPGKLGKRLLALTIVRIFVATNIEFSREHNFRFLNFARSACPDVFKRLKINEKQPLFEQIQTLKLIDSMIDELLQPLEELACTTDLRVVLQRMNTILKALNNSLIKGIMAQHLPPSFVKTAIPAIFESLQHVDTCSDSQFIEYVDLARHEISQAKIRLTKAISFYSARYFLPLLENMSRLVEQTFASSDATKPAHLTLESYPRKYPFHATGTQVLLRFVVDNHGPGPAQNIKMQFTLFDNLTPDEKTVWISELGVGRQAVDINVKIGDIEGSVEFYVKMSWDNVDLSDDSHEFTGILQCQNSSVTWEKLIREDPYSIEAIDRDSGRPFVGRETDVLQLLRGLSGKSMSSAYIYGQKRVGKTSLALEVAYRAVQDNPNIYHIYLEGGDYVETSAQGTLQSLGRQLAKRMKKENRQLERIPLPEFSDSLSPLNEFVDDVIDTLPEARFILMLDEFDELPLELYKRGPMGDGFFLTLRALSSRSRIGIILVGGEKMGPIISTQGDQLNRFTSLRIDYFRRDEHWSDFQNLVREPVNDSIEYSEGAIEKVYHWSAGNPFFTNVICNEVFQRCCDRRDAFVSELEVEECASLACSKIGAPSFQHFWEDGVLDTGSKTEDVSIKRRKVLLALAAALRARKKALSDVLAEQRDLIGMSPVSIDTELNRFVARGVLVENQGEYSCRVFMFEQFLAERSAEMISTEFTDLNDRQKLEQADNEAYVQASEIGRLVQKWGVYGSSQVSDEQVRAWLSQFESNKDQRVMFRLLTSLRFYSEPMVREKLRSAMDFIRKETVWKIEDGKRRRRDILVSYFGGVAKSGTQYARIFCQENKIIVGNVVGVEALRARLMVKNDDVQAVVMVDDIIGTGSTIIDSLKTINEQIGDLLRELDIQLFLVIICGFADTQKNIEKIAVELKLPLHVYCSDSLQESDRAFSETSTVFDNEGDRNRANQLAMEWGEKLEKKWPLGHGDSQALIVFFANCPNNTLPIIYKDGTDWTALFPRR